MWIWCVCVETVDNKPLKLVLLSILRCCRILIPAHCTAHIPLAHVVISGHKLISAQSRATPPTRAGNEGPRRSFTITDWRNWDPDTKIIRDICINRFLNIKVLVGSFDQDKVLVGEIVKSSRRFASSSTAHLPLIRTRPRIKHSEILAD